MFTTFDRYLLRRYLHTFCIVLVSTYGLFVVIDGFTNVDGFQEGQEDAWATFQWMALYYAYQSTLFFDLTGAIVSAIAVMVVFGLLQKHSEIQPILAAGVPTYRLLLPFVLGTLVVNTLLVANQELVIPRIAHQLQAPRSLKADGGKEVEPIYDENTICIDGQNISFADRRMHGAEFILPVPGIVAELTTLKASEAAYVDRAGDRPAGWLLKDVSPPHDQLSLTPHGRGIVHAIPDTNNVFVISSVTFDHLYNRNRGYRYASTPELIDRVRRPSFGNVTVRAQVLHLHSRFVTPLANIVVLFVAVPLLLRRESRSLIGNMAGCAAVLAALYAGSQFFLYLGRANLIAPEVAVWAPVIGGGMLGAWLSGIAQT